MHRENLNKLCKNLRIDNHWLIRNSLEKSSWNKSRPAFKWNLHSNVSSDPLPTSALVYSYMSTFPSVISDDRIQHQNKRREIEVPAANVAVECGMNTTTTKSFWKACVDVWGSKKILIPRDIRKPLDYIGEKFAKTFKRDSKVTYGCFMRQSHHSERFESKTRKERSCGFIPLVEKDVMTSWFRWSSPRWGSLLN